MLSDDRGVSVIIGAMLLILITLVAAASLAVIVSEAQKQDADRRAHQAAVENEKLVITGIDPEVENHMIKSLDVTVQNLNIADSRLMTFYINDNPCHNFSIKSINGIDKTGQQNWKWLYNHNITNRFDVPASSTVVVHIDLTPDKSTYVNPDDGLTYPLYPWDFLDDLTVSDNSNIKIKTMTSYINVFNRTFNHPDAIAEVRILTQDFGNFRRDYLALDATDSSSESSIKNYEWTIKSGATVVQTKSGKKVNAFLESGGPFTVILTVTDNNELVDETDPIDVPPSDVFNPPAHIKMVRQPSPYADTIQVFVTDIKGNNINADVSLITNPASMVLTINYGNTGGVYLPFQVISGSGTITAISGSLSTTIPYNVAPLVANFEADQTIGTAPLAVQFTDLSQGTIDSWEWYLDNDGTSDSTEQNPLFVYNTPGTYTVKLIVSNSAGSNSKEYLNYITVA